MGRNKQFPMMSPADKAWATRRAKQEQTKVPHGTERLTAAQKAWQTRRGGHILRKPWERPEGDPRFPRVQWYVVKNSRGEPLAYSAAESKSQAEALLSKTIPIPPGKVELCPDGKCPF